MCGGQTFAQQESVRCDAATVLCEFPAVIAVSSREAGFLVLPARVVGGLALRKCQAVPGGSSHTLIFAAATYQACPPARDLKSPNCSEHFDVQALALSSHAAPVRLVGRLSALLSEWPTRCGHADPWLEATARLHHTWLRMHVPLALLRWRLRVRPPHSEVFSNAQLGYGSGTAAWSPKADDVGSIAE